MRVLVLHGPNLNLLGQRPSRFYGDLNLTELNAFLTREAEHLGIEIECFQSNHEGALVDRIQGATAFDGIVINPGGFGHSSVAIRDAVEAAPVPVIEVHLSNLAARESFRHHTLLAPVCRGQITGLGPQSYAAALYVLARSGAQGS